MEINRLDIRYYLASEAVCTQEGLTHKKSLPYLSVVQATEGNYEIGLNGARPSPTGPGGIFIAPAGAAQTIIHHLGPSGVMRMRWLFLDARANGQYRLEDLRRFPLILPASLCAPIGERIAALLQGGRRLCADLAKLYEMLDILLAISEPIAPVDELALQVRRYLEDNYAQDITIEQISEQFHISKATLFRKFQAAFGITPARFLNDFRLEQASLLLEHSLRPVGEVAAKVGIADSCYFAKCFREKYHCSPSAYRRSTRYHPSGAGASHLSSNKKD